MKKLLGIIVVSLLLSGNANADVRIMNKGFTHETNRYDKRSIQAVCVDGFKFVVVIGPEAAGITQYFIEKDGKSVPAKC